MSKLKIEKQREVYRLTAADYYIIEQGRKDPNWITDHYMKHPQGGTRYMRTPVPYDEEKVRGWNNLNQVWVDKGMPQSLFEYNNTEYKVLYDADGYPIFWHHHGWLWQDWQKEWFLCEQPEVTVIGGMGSGKTATEAAILATLAMITPGFRGFAVAPQMLQAMEIYKYITMWFKDTLWWDRFVWGSPRKPYPQFVLRSDYIGESTIEILSVEKDPEKVRTLEGDIIIVDQAEKFMELDDLIRDVGSRLRGQIHGRAKLGKLHIVANAGDNPQLWQRYDMAEWEPHIYKNFNPAAWENIYLTKVDIENLKRRVGGEESDVDQWLAGKRPMGAGEHFPPQMVKDCTDEGMNHIMDEAQDLIHRARDMIEQSHGKSSIILEELPEYYYIKKASQKTGVYHWELPAEHKAGRNYITVGDPGQGTPPDRNSGVVMTWDITDFPGKPATLRCFDWVFGRGEYWPFFNEYERQVKQYRSHGRNGFDSTGSQKGFDELAYAMQGLHAEGLNMAGNGKYLSLNAAKMFMGKRLMQFPYISHLSAQLTNYKIPDNKIRQDLVMCLCMSALYMRRYYWEDVFDEEDTGSAETRVDRHYRESKTRNQRYSGKR